MKSNELVTLRLSKNFVHKLSANKNPSYLAQRHHTTPTPFSNSAQFKFMTKRPLSSTGNVRYEQNVLDVQSRRLNTKTFAHDPFFPSLLILFQVCRTSRNDLVVSLNLALYVVFPSVYLQSSLRERRTLTPSCPGFSGPLLAHLLPPLDTTFFFSIRTSEHKLMKLFN